MRAWVLLAAGAVLYGLAAAWAVAHLPADGIPIHFTASGRPDRFGGRDQVVRLWVSLGAGMLALGVALVLLARRGPLRLMNVPHREYWTAARREPLLRRMLAVDSAAVMGATLVLLACIPVWTVLATRDPGGALPPLVLWLPVALYLGGLAAWTVWLVVRRYRPRPDG